MWLNVDKGVETMQLTRDVVWTGVLDPKLQVFDVVIPTAWGSTYNSYLIRADKPALIDTVKADFAEDFLAKLEQEIDLKDLRYLIVNHTEPDHSGSVPLLLKKAPHLTVYGSRAAIRFLRQQVNDDFAAVAVGHNDTLDLGNKTLRFISAPFLHWPDTMFTYLEEDEILFTCDGFGAHYCDPDRKMLASEVGGHMEQVKYYYDSIMSPFQPKILDAVERVRELSIEVIAPGHGPILDADPWSYVDAYEKWSRGGSFGTKQVVVAYASAYGNTRAMAETILAGLESVQGVSAQLHDVGQMSDEEMQDVLIHFDGLVVGSPTFNADAVAPIWRFLSHINPIKHKGKLAAAFGNYGWSGEAVGLMEKKMESARLALVQPGLRINFAPSKEDSLELQQWGSDFASALVRSHQVEQAT